MPQNQTIALVGLGGVGCQVAKLLYNLNFTDVTLIDFDTVERRNLKRQDFTESDIGKNKAEVLARKYDWTFIPYRFSNINVDTILCCVDTKSGRRAVRDCPFANKIYAANEHLDAEAYTDWETYEEAFQGEDEPPALCGEDPQTLLANTTAAVFMVHLLLNKAPIVTGISLTGGMPECQTRLKK